MKPIIISIDDFKEKITGYNPEKAERFHAQSAKLANKEFDKVVRTTKIKRVILLSGGSASGKTEYMMTYLVNKNAVIFDSTLPTTEGAKIKIKKCSRFKKKTEVHFIIPDDINRSFSAFLLRKRRFSEESFYKTHIGARKTILWIAENIPDVKIKIISSHYDHAHKKMIYKDRLFVSSKELLDYIKSIQYNSQEDIKKGIVIYDRKNIKTR